MPISPTEYYKVKERKIMNYAEPIISIIDKEILDYDKVGISWVSIVINQDVRLDVREYIAQQYIEAGWHTVIHKTNIEDLTNMEDDDVPGLTEFVFCTRVTFQDWMDHNNPSKFHIVRAK